MLTSEEAAQKMEVWVAQETDRVRRLEKDLGKSRDTEVRIDKLYHLRKLDNRDTIETPGTDNTFSDLWIDVEDAMPQDVLISFADSCQVVKMTPSRKCFDTCTESYQKIKTCRISCCFDDEHGVTILCNEYKEVRPTSLTSYSTGSKLDEFSASLTSLDDFLFPALSTVQDCTGLVWVKEEKRGHFCWAEGT